MSEFKDKVVIITGASSGIGRATAQEYAKHGAKLVLHGRSSEKNLTETGTLCISLGVPPENICYIRGDFSEDQNVCNKIVDSAIEKFGQIDILVNNAGNVGGSNFENSTVEDLDLMYKLHVRTLFIITKRALPHLEKTKGSIVNISSIAGSNALPYLTTYGIAKAAVLHFTRTLAQEMAPKGVRVNCVNPGIIQTRIFTRPGGHIAGRPEELPEFYEKMAKAHPMQRIGQPQEVAGCIVFLTSAAAGFMTGAALPISGGRHDVCSVYN